MSDGWLSPGEGWRADWQEWRDAYVPSSKERTRQIIDMYLKGMKPDEIGKKFGIYGPTVIYHLKKAGFLFKGEPEHQKRQRERLRAQLAEIAKSSPCSPVVRTFGSFAHASVDVWTPERMWHQMEAEK